jgi:hypothetical protein
MTSFEETRAALRDAAAERAAAADRVRSATETGKRLRREIDRLARGANTGSGAATAARVEELRERLSAAAADARRLETALGEARQREVGLRAVFEPLTDATTAVANLPDTHPFLLFPVRLETRFGAGPDGRRQLWVRVFPDDVLVDTFDPQVAETERTNTRIYWINVWRAQGSDAGHRAAWRSLAKSHGTGRARWLLDQFAPLNPEDVPTPEDGDHILVITPAEPIADAAERQAIADYWSAAWQATADAATDARAVLDAALGAARAAEVVTDLVPVNFVNPTVTRAAGMVVGVAFLDLPPDPPTSELPWSKPATAWLLPERFVLVAVTGDTTTAPIVGNRIPAELQVGPDPLQDPADSLSLDEEGDLTVPAAMAWTVDFEEAVKVGMGFRVDLTDEQARVGFDRLLVLGVRLGDDAGDGAADLETLFTHHQNSRKGLALLPQGTPTNNTDQDTSGYTWWEDPDAAYDHYFVRDPDHDPADWRERSDGRWLAGLLGVDRDVLKRSPAYFGTDLATARAMNLALWPATLGYFLDQMMAPLVPLDVATTTRSFFTRFVLGSGTAPAIRVGRQPYGILPTTAYSRARWFLDLGRNDPSPDGGATRMPPDLLGYLAGLFSLVEAAVPIWRRLAANAARVGMATGDPQQILLDVVGLHPASVEYYQRYAESFDEVFNLLAFVPGSPQAEAFAVVAEYVRDGLRVLAELGVPLPGDGAYPEILGKLFLREPSLLQGDLVDVAPPSETEPLAVHRADGRNYLEWLASAARTSHDTLRRQAGFDDDVPPAALLYLLARHALDLGFVDTGIDLLAGSEVLDPAQVAVARAEPRFIHVAEAEADTGSRWQHLYRPAEVVTGDPQLVLGEYIPRVLEELGPYLNEQLAAIDRLAGVPQAGLERALVGHLDCCSYRLDAWRGGLVATQLALMRGDDGGSGDGETPPDGRRGVLIGAYGWLEDVRPRTAATEPVALDPELAAIFQRADDTPLGRDPANAGHIHAPSLDHAVTAAILRSGHLANATPGNPGALDVNLSSARVRAAMTVVEGIRNGQSLGALLGYRLERSLHDHDDLFLDRLIVGLRRRFPLAGNRQASTSTDDPDIPVSAVEARNVVDGLALVEHLDEAGPNPTYPYGIDGLPTLDDLAAATPLTPAQVGAIVDATMDGLRDTNDAVADLAMAEATFQLVRGNYDRAAGTLDAFARGNWPPTPDVAAIPRSGAALTHRVGIHLPGGMDPLDVANTTPRAKGEPALNAWVGGLLPPMPDLTAAVVHTDPATGLEVTRELSMADLGLLPIDLLHLAGAGTGGGMPGLDELLLHHARRDGTPLRDDVTLRPSYPPATATGTPLFSVVPLVASLRGLVLGSRPLRPSDLALANEAGRMMDQGTIARDDKAAAVIAALTTDVGPLRALATELEAAVGDGVTEANSTAAALTGLDGWVAGYGDAVDELRLFGLPAVDLALATDRVRPHMTSLLAAVDVLARRWAGQRTAFGAVMDEYDALPPAATDDERYALLIRAGRTVSTTVIAPLPPLDDMVTTVHGLDDDLRQALGDLADVPNGRPHLGELYGAAAAFAPRVDAFEPQPWDLSAYPTAILSVARDLLRAATTAVADVDTRLATAQGLLDALPATEPSRATTLVLDAVRAVLGEAFVVVPEFTLAADRLAEWENAWADRDAILDHLKTGPEGTPFPVDDWLHGLARVREKLGHAERVVLLGEALGVPGDLELKPLQFPYRTDDGWLGGPFPATMPGTGEPFRVDSDRLLYTAHVGPDAEVDPSHPARTYCGVLVDEWVEVVPGVEETTGLAFHYDRPSSEAPQALLLATPPRFTGAWAWDDLVDTLTETLDAARLRTVEPGQLDRTDLSRFLPAVLSSVTVYPITAALNFSFNNTVQNVLVREEG